MIKFMELLYILTIILSLLLPLLIIIFYCQTSATKQTSSSKISIYCQIKFLIQVLKNHHRLFDLLTENLTRSPTHTMVVKTPAYVSAIFTANPINVEHILKTNFNNYPKGDRAIGMLEDFLGHGIFNADGDHWKKQRLAASFELNKPSLRHFMMDAVRYEILERLLPLLAKSAEKNETIDLQDVLERFAFDNICKVAFGEDPASLSEAKEGTMADFMEAFGDVQNLIRKRFRDVLPITWRIKKLLNIGSEKQLKRSVSTVQKFATKIAKLRKERFLDHHDHDLLSRFASNKDYSVEFLRDVVTNFTLAGREASSAALTWFFWLLSTRPDVKERILEEVRGIRVAYRNSKCVFSFEELREMNYLHAAISEAMRLYPPVPINTQSCLEDSLMPDGTFVGRGWIVAYSSYAMGRMEDLWGKDCREYKPERWLENGAFKPPNPFRYPVFHAGPRMCLGKEMAYIQMKSIVASILERFDISVMLEKEKTPEYVISLTLRMKGGLPVRVRDREPKMSLSTVEI